VHVLKTEGRLSDLDYCYASWKLLTDLETNSYARNQCVRDFQEKVNRRESFVSILLALILPVILWGYFLINSFSSSGKTPSIGENFGNFWTRLLGILMISILLFLIIFLFSRILWTKNSFRFLKNMFESDLKAKLMDKISPIDDEARRIAYRSIFEEGRIPNDFLSAEMLPLLIRYFERKQATTMKEAVYSLELDLKNTGYYGNLLSNDNLLQREKEYLSDEKGNLDKIIKEAEKK
jgi:uncharacterized membrane protein (DUF485 family)